MTLNFKIVILIHRFVCKDQARFDGYLTDHTLRVVIGEHTDDSGLCSTGLCTGSTAVPPVYCHYIRHNLHVSSGSKEI